jgi:hypothetical protein
MSSVRSLLRPITKWTVPRRNFHSTNVFRATAEQQEEAATQRKCAKKLTNFRINNNFCSIIGAERTMTRFWKRAGIKEDKGTLVTLFISEISRDFHRDPRLIS